MHFLSKQGQTASTQFSLNAATGKCGPQFYQNSYFFKERHKSGFFFKYKVFHPLSIDSHFFKKKNTIYGEQNASVSQI